MNPSFLYSTPTIIIVITLFILMLFFSYAGFWVKKYQEKKNKEGVVKSFGAVEGSLLGLLALLLAFTFGMSASRYDARRAVITEEANDIGTAVLRADLYPDSIRQNLRSHFKEYVNARIAFYNAGNDKQKIQEAYAASNLHSSAIWNKVAQLQRGGDFYYSNMQMIPAINAMLDVVTVRDSTGKAHVPDSIVWLLFMLTLTASFVIGYGYEAKRINWVVQSVFALMTIMAIYLILDLDRPRRGLINMDAAHEKMIELRKMF